MQVVKRDGKRADFDFEKVRSACIKAGCDYSTASIILPTIISKMEERNELHVEEIQDIVIDCLKKICPEIASKYMTYREERNKIRNSKRDLIFKELIEVKGSDVAKENGNMNSETPSGMISKAGFEYGKEYAINHLLSKDAKEGHLAKDFHIHDLDFFPTKSETCLFADLSQVLKNGFNTVNGGVRPAKKITSAIRLVAMSIQTSQSEQHGGQAIHSFDYALAPYVKASYESIVDDLIYENSYNFTEHQISEIKKNESLKNRDYFYSHNITKDYSDVNRCLKVAMNRLVKEVKQGMKGLIHDLNIMNSRSGNQVEMPVNHGNMVYIMG